MARPGRRRSAARRSVRALMASPPCDPAPDPDTFALTYDCPFGPRDMATGDEGRASRPGGPGSPTGPSAGPVRWLAANSAPAQVKRGQDGAALGLAPGGIPLLALDLGAPLVTERHVDRAGRLPFQLPW